MEQENNSLVAGTGDVAGAGDMKTNRRTYDCSFCKRGFTNAQALGGHMNIHRKERSKSKRNHLSSSSSSSSPAANPNFTSPPPPPPVPFYPIIESQTYQGGDHDYTYGGFLHARGDHISMNPNPRGQFGHYSGENVIAHEEFLGVDLSLGLGSMHVFDDEGGSRPSEAGASNAGDGDLDLELRLGHHGRRR